MSEPSLLLSQFPKQSTVSGRVTMVSSSRALLLLERDIYGYIPARELAWTQVDQPRRFIREGQQIEAIVIGFDQVRNQLVLSRRLALRNPWHTIADDYSIGSVHLGRVSQVVQYGAFVELEPGVVGLAHIRELPFREGTEQPIDLWPSDRVLVQVRAIDHEQHRISLSMKAVIEERDRRVGQHRLAVKESGSTIAEVLGVRADPLANVTLPWYDPDSQVQDILLVDDDRDFGNSTVEWMTLLGYHATHVETIGAARGLLAGQHPFSLLLVDYDLPDGTGLELVQAAVSQLPDLQVVLLSAQADRQLCLTEPSIPQLLCWNKPFSMRDFGELLRIIRDDKCRICQRRRIDKGESSVSLDLDVRQQTLASIEQVCANELGGLMKTTGAQVGLVCEVDTGSQRVRIIAQEGSGITLRGQDLEKLIHSPVNDVCVREEVLRVANMHEQLARFRYLLPLGSFSSFLGVPVRSGGHDKKLGLLLLQRESGYFTNLHQQHALLSAGMLGLHLERQDILRAGLSSQQTLLAGRLSLSLAHEVQKQISTLSSQVETLNAHLHKLRGKNEWFGYQTLLESGVPDVAMRLQRAVRGIGSILNRQLDFARPYTMSRLDINGLVERVLQMIGPIAKQERIYLVQQLDRAIPPIYSASLVIQQIFLNLMFNAIQQMAEAGIYQGELLVRTEYVEGSALPVRVLFTDCGPGIHASYFDQLFQHGFTTRSGGTGQGLYISRTAAEALGGRLSLLESFVGYGSTFELELPLQAEEPRDV